MEADSQFYFLLGERPRRSDHGSMMSAMWTNVDRVEYNDCLELASGSFAHTPRMRIRKDKRSTPNCQLLMLDKKLK